MRFSAPVPHATFRVTTDPVTLDGVEIPAGEQVLVCLAAANRDPSASATPTRSTSPAKTEPTSASGTASTSASAHRSPASRPASRSTTLLRRHPDLRLAVDRNAARAGPTATGSCSAASNRSPCVLGPDRTEPDSIRTKPPKSRRRP